MKGKLKNVFIIQVIQLLILAGIDIYIYTEHRTVGLALTICLVVYALVVVAFYTALLPSFRQEIVDYATGFGIMQRRLLTELEVPYALLDDSGKILWCNQKFQQHAKVTKDYHKSITSLYSGITKELLSKVVEDHHQYLAEDDSFYHVHIRRIFMDETIESLEDKRDSINEKESLFALYVFDETQLHQSLKENEDQKLVSALVYIDNYEEALDSIEEVKRSLLIALVDRKVNKYFSNIDGIIKKIEKDKYFIVFKKRYLEELEEDKFSLLEEVKTIKIGNEMAITLSIGIGNSSKSYNQNYEYTRAAIDLALGRGGDQAVVKSSEMISYYGGKTQQIEKTTRVKARVKALALRELLEGKEQVIVMGHSLTDIDAFGAAIGIHKASSVLGKKSYICVNEISSSLRPLMERFKAEEGFDSSLFLTSEQALEVADKNNTVVVVVDTNKPSYTECPQLLNMVKTIVVFDHHRQGAEVISNATLSYIEPYASSTCEMISEVLQYFSEDIKLDQVEADALYAGILIDTNNFMTKTGVRTFEAAAYLKRNGTDVTRVRKMLRNDMSEFKARAEAVRSAENYHGYAISECPSDGIESPTIAGAQAANELLNIVGIKASFVLTSYQDKIYISSRSIDEVNVQIIMEKLGGGGHMNVAGAQLTGMTLGEAKTRLKEVIDEVEEL